MVNTVELSLSGSTDRTYTYLWEEAALDHWFEPSVGDRVVVPSRLKSDGTLSLAVGTIVSIQRDVPEHLLNPTVQFKHVIQFLSPERLKDALVRVQADEAAAQSPIADQLAASIEAARKQHGI